MAKVVGCALIVKDDFNNVLILQDKVKRGEPEKWTLLNQKIKGKETEEKCINRCVKDALKTVVFDLERVKEYLINDDEAITLYSGSLKDRIVLDKKYKDYKWIGLRQISNYNFNDVHIAMLQDYFNV